MNKTFLYTGLKRLYNSIVVLIFFTACGTAEIVKEIDAENKQPVTIIFKVKAELNYVWFNGGVGGRVNYKVKKVLSGSCKDTIIDINFFGREYFRDISSYCRDLYYREVIIEKRVFFDSAFHYSVADKRLIFDSIKRRADTALFAEPCFKRKNDHPDRTKTGPLEFLKFLRNKNLSCLVLDDSLLKYPAGSWIKAKDVDSLMKLIESTEPVIPVYENYCMDNIYSVYSTLGREALFLIEGFRSGKYPPFHASILFPNEAYNKFETRPIKPGTYPPEKNKISETKRWWKINKAKYLK